MIFLLQNVNIQRKKKQKRICRARTRNKVKEMADEAGPSADIQIQRSIFLGSLRQSKHRTGASGVNAGAAVCSTTNYL